jgi:outer membrane protein assembly factor BamB
MCVKAVSLAVLASFIAVFFTACLGPRGSPGAAVEGNTLFVGTMDGRVLALDIQDASLKWGWQAPKTSTSNPGGCSCSSSVLTRGGTFYQSPVIAQGTVYVGTFGGGVYALDAASGLEIWHYNAKSSLVGGMAVNNSTLLFGASDGKLYALDVSGDSPSGVSIFNAENGIWSTPVLYDGIVYFGSLDHNLYAADATSGHTKWVFKTSGEIVAAPLVSDGIVYVGSLDNKLYAVYADTGKPSWVFQEAGNGFWSSPVCVNGTLYAGCLDHNVYALDAGNGTPAWPKAFKTSAPIYSAPIVIGETLVVASGDGSVYGIDLATGDRRWQINTKSSILSPLSVTGNTVFVVTQGNDLWAVDARNGVLVWRVSLGKGEVRRVE